MAKNTRRQARCCPFLLNRSGDAHKGEEEKKKRLTYKKRQQAMTSEGSCNSHSNGFIMNQSNTAADAFLATTTTKKS